MLKQASLVVRRSYLVVRPFGECDLKRDTKYTARDTVLFEIRFTGVESDAKTKLGRRRVLTRQGWAGEKPAFSVSC